MIDTVHIGAGSYPNAPEPEDKKEYEVIMKMKIYDIFPETWEKDEIENFVDFIMDYENILKRKEGRNSKNKKMDN